MFFPCQHFLSSYASYATISLHVHASTKASTEFLLQFYIQKHVLIYQMMLTVKAWDVKWDKVTHGFTR